MTIQEFFKQQPDLLKNLKKCNTEEEFIMTAEKSGVKIGTDLIKNIYEYVKSLNKTDGELSKDKLNEVSGGLYNFVVNSFIIGGKEINLIT